MQIDPVSFTDAEREEYRQESLARFAEQAGLTDPPEGVEVIAWTQGKVENGEALAECLQEAGFPAVSNASGGIIFDPGVPESQVKALDLADYICQGKYPLDPVYAQEWTQDQLRLVYDYWDEYFIPCMEAHGHPIDTGDQPSREAYVAAFHTPDRISWWPNDAFRALPLEEQKSLARSCPPYPPDEAMYGQ